VATHPASIYLKQLLVGRDIGQDDDVGSQMENFIYLVGDRDAKECFVIDPAWDIQGIVDVAANDGMSITGALCTHYHPDHVGGSLFGFDVQGLARLLALNPCKIHAHEKEVAGIRTVTGISESDIQGHAGNDKIAAGAIEVELLHTPGHTPGSSCYRVKDALLSGDTLFLQGCGRVDLPGGDAEEMRRTLQQRLSKIEDDVVLYPGHAYGGEHATLAVVRKKNPVFRMF
jgi:glyoxylase-like metal-dependent hydrolase (beta-lactamase superfamily II)